ncbi:MAG: hypothetical protein HZB67_01515 [Candidatus Aenigmarchaeota archaeon]|nr:hypothetical protein [Candidatus Aenigmarchaeota archaeon]
MYLASKACRQRPGTRWKAPHHLRSAIDCYYEAEDRLLESKNGNPEDRREEIKDLIGWYERLSKEFNSLDVPI